MSRSKIAQVIYTCGNDRRGQEHDNSLWSTVVYFPVWEMSTSVYEWKFQRPFANLNFVFAWNKGSGERYNVIREYGVHSHRSTDCPVLKKIFLNYWCDWTADLKICTKKLRTKDRQLNKWKPANSPPKQRQTTKYKHSPTQLDPDGGSGIYIV